MTWFFLGPPRSGKSALAEKLVASLPGKVLYVATLPRNAYQQPTIDRHAARRPPEWNVLELLHDPLADIESLHHALLQSNTVLIDGVSYYLFRCLTEFDLALRAAVFRELYNTLYLQKRNIILVDPPVSPLLPLPLRRQLLTVHSHFLRCSDSIILTLNGGTAIPVHSREAFDYDMGHAEAARRRSR